MDHIGYFFTRLVAELFRFVPFRPLYVLSDALAFLLRNVIGYRKAVVDNNLRRAFPDKTPRERAEIARLFYRNLTDVTLETLKSYTMSVAEIARRCPPRNPERVNRYLDGGQSVLLAGSHYNNWEYSGISMPPAFHGATVTAYKPISNVLIDAYVNRSRERAGMEMVSMDGTFAAIRHQEHEGRRAVFILLSDQSPSSRKSAHWVDFLGQKTASLPGLDVLARKFKMPVVYYHIRRLRRGFYEVEFFDLCPDPAAAAEGATTQAYAARLEAFIREQPENWLWSHKRWKMKPEEQ